MRSSLSSRPRKLATLHWLLVLALLAQGAIPLQAHTSLEADETGRVIVICTWHGPQERPWPHDGDEPQPAAEGFSPAVMFSQLLASADLYAHTLLAESVLVPVIALTEPRYDAALSPADPVYAIRAPPPMSSIDA